MASRWCQKPLPKLPISCFAFAHVGSRIMPNIETKFLRIKKPLAMVSFGSSKAERRKRHGSVQRKDTGAFLGFTAQRSEHFGAGSLGIGHVDRRLTLICAI